MPKGNVFAFGSPAHISSTGWLKTPTPVYSELKICEFRSNYSSPRRMIAVLTAPSSVLGASISTKSSLCASKTKDLLDQQFKVRNSMLIIRLVHKPVCAVYYFSLDRAVIACGCSEAPGARFLVMGSALVLREKSLCCMDTYHKTQSLARSHSS